MKNYTDKELIKIAKTFLAVAVVVFFTTIYGVLHVNTNVSHETGEALDMELVLEVVNAEKPYKTLQAYVTGYNTVPEQTDATPCISATGDDICGRSDVVACPRSIELGTKVEIDGKRYVCLDRTAKKFNNRFDISCDKDMTCPYEVTGHKEVRIYE